MTVPAGTYPEAYHGYLEAEGTVVATVFNQPITQGLTATLDFDLSPTVGIVRREDHEITLEADGDRIETVVGLSPRRMSRGV